MKILFAVFGAMGDVINAIPVVRALRYKFPKAEIVWMTLPRYKDIAECPYVDRVILCGHGRLGNGIPQEVLLKERFNIVYYPQASVHHDEWVASRIPLMDFMAAKCNVDLTDRSLEVAIDDVTRKSVDELFEKEKLHYGETVVFSCKTLSCKNWRLKNYQRLAKEIGTRVILIGGSDDEPIDGAVDCRGYPIKMGIEIIQRSALYVGGDTGPTWMACCTPTPVVVFTDPVRKAWVHVGFKQVVPKKNITELSVSSDYGAVLRLCRKLLNNEGITISLAELKVRGFISDVIFQSKASKTIAASWKRLSFLISQWNSKCAFCGSNRYEIVYRLERAKTIRECQRCGLVYLHPRPDTRSLESYYTDQYKVGADELKDIRRLDISAIENTKYSRQRELGFVTEHKKSGKLLDIGCSWGFLMVQAQKLGFSVMGVELSRLYALYGKEELGLDIFIGSLDEANYPSDYFDVITAIHVLEHVPDPKCTLKGIGRIIKSDGLLLLIVPNFDSYTRKCLGSKWEWLDVNSHYYYFTKQVLEREMLKLGFAARFTSEEGHYGMDFLNRHCQKGSIGNIFQKLQGSELVVVASKRG